MRLSRPMPRATSCTLAPTFSERSAISLMKVILVARNAFAAYLIISAVRRSVNIKRRLVQRQRAIDVAHHLAAALVGGADDDTVGELEIADRRALAQELGVGGNDDVGLWIGLANDALDLIAGADRNGRLGHHDGEAGQRLRDLFRGGIDIGEIGMTVAAARRRADRDEDSIGIRDRLGQIGGELQPLGLHVGRDQLVEPGLVDRDLAAMKSRDLLLVLVDADDVVTEIRKAGSGHQSHIARADHRNAH